METTKKVTPPPVLCLLAALFFLCLFAPMAAGQDNPATDNWKDHLNSVDKLANTGGGDGLSWKNAIEIASAEELAYFAQQVNSQGDIALGSGGGPIKHNGKGGDATGFKGYYFALAADIDLSDYDWTPIGNATYPFEGNFDGRGHCVKGLKVRQVEIVSRAVYAGLFGYAYVGTLRNLGVRLADAGIQANLTEGSACVGGIAGYAYEIFNCYVVGEGTIEASISGYGIYVNGIHAGGIVGYLDNGGSLTNCYATVNVKVEPKSTVHVGGIVGYGDSKSTISCTYATGDVETGTGENYYYAGGICGYLQNTLKNSLAVNGRIIGGNPLSNRIVGKNESQSALTDNYASPEIRVNGNSVIGGAANDANGNPEVNLDNFGSVFTWGDGWNTGDGTHLPQLKMQTGDGPSYSYIDWPTGDGYTSQPSLDVTRYLIATRFAGGNGDKDNPYQIANRAQLAYLAKQVNGGTENDGKENDKKEDYTDKYFILTADIDMSSFFWTPIGKDSKHPFKGNFDGKGYCVKGLKVRQENTKKDNVYAGLFGLASAGTLRNLGVWLAKEGVWAGPSSESTEGFFYANAGGIAGQADYIFNCYVTGEGVVESVGKSKDNGGPSSNVSSSSRAGGIVGNLHSSLSNCYATVGVKASGASDNDVKANSYAGGIAGFGSSDSRYGLSQTYATGVVEAAGDGYNYAGGIYGSHSTGPFSNNLALNPEIKVTGDEGMSGRIFGKTTSIYNKPSDNYASPKILVNGYSVSGGADSDMNGDPGVDLGNFRSVITWGDGWDTDDDMHLPQLMMQEGEDENGIPTYSPWPTGNGYTPQPLLDATRYLNTEFAGDGDEDNPYQIANRAQLAYLAKQVNAGKDNGGTDYEGKYFILTADIDLSPFFWTPIGKDYDHSFKGNFDGKGHCVKGLKVYVESSDKYTVWAGLFGCTNTGTLCNLGVWLAEEGVHIVYSGSSDAYAGGIAGQAKYVFNCYVTGEGEVKAEATFSSQRGPRLWVGGIAGYITGALSDCYATVDVKARGKGRLNYAGGIAGYASIESTFSRTYTTGAVEAASGTENYAGGICGRIDKGTLSYNLALNSEITGDEGKSGRITGLLNYASSSANYASTKTKCNSKDNLYGSDGTPTCLETFLDDLKDQGNGWGDSWDIGDGTNLPKLRMKVKEQDGSSYEPWLDGQQPSLLASNYLSTLPKLHIVSPTGGTLTVSDQDGKEVPNDTKIRPGTSLTLTYAENTNYRFSRYLSGSSADNLQALSGNTIEMPDADLWLSADFNYQDPTPPPPPPTVYYTVSLPSVEGTVTDPSAGSYEVESWSTFCFYLMPEPDYSESEPVVTTSRGETIMPRTSDGAYLVKYVRTDVEIFIDGIVKNLPPVANEPIRAVAPEPEIWNEDACLCIRLPEGMPTSPVRIFTPEGRLLHAFRSTPGLNRRQLPTGIYILQVGDTVRKVLIK